MEYDNRGKSNSFVDRRFKGIDPSLPPEEQKYLLMQKQKQREVENMKYGEEVSFTHGGKDLNFGKSAFSGGFDEQSEEGLGFNFVDGDSDMEAEDGFGGLAKKEASGGQKTPKEIYAEMIQKSKVARSQAQKQRALLHDETATLDEGFDELSELLGKYKKRESDRQKEINEMMARMQASVAQQQQAADSTEIGESGKQPIGMVAVEADDFDRMARELAGEARAIASDPLLTEEDVALARKRKLQQLEEQRVKRMLGDDYVAKSPADNYGADDLDDGLTLGASYDYNMKKKKRKEKMTKAEKAAQRKKDAKKKKGASSSEDESDSEGTGSEDSLGSASGEADSWDLEDSDDDEREGEEESEGSDDDEIAVDDLQDKALLALGPSEEIPYTIQMPASFELFQSLLASQSADRRKVIIRRLRTCYNLALNPANRAVQETLYEYIFRFILGLADQASFNDADVVSITQVLFGMTKEMPVCAGNLLRKYLSDTEKSFSRGAIRPRDLFLVQLVNLLCPVTDRRHVIVTPALQTMCLGLVNSSATSLDEVTLALALSAQITNFILPAKRFVNEPFVYYASILTLWAKELARLHESRNRSPGKAMSPANPPNADSFQTPPKPSRSPAKEAREKQLHHHEPKPTDSASSPSASPSQSPRDRQKELKRSYWARPSHPSNSNAARTNTNDPSPHARVTSAAPGQSVRASPEAALQPQWPEVLAVPARVTSFSAFAPLAQFRSATLFAIPSLEDLVNAAVSPLKLFHDSSYWADQTHQSVSLVNTTLLAFRRYTTVFTTSDDSNFFDGAVSLLTLALELLREINQYSPYFPVQLRKSVADFVQFLEHSIHLREGKLKAMQLHAKVGITIHKELTPEFDERYAGRNKKYANMTRETREVKVLQRKVKQERKGAEREIKLDAQYLSRKRADKRKEMDEDRMKKTKDLMHTLTVQQHDAKVMDRMSKKKKSAF